MKLILALIPLILLFVLSVPALAQEYELNVVNQSNTPVEFEIFQPQCVLTSSQITTVPPDSKVTEIQIVDQSGSCKNTRAQAKLILSAPHEPHTEVLTLMPGPGLSRAEADAVIAAEHNGTPVEVSYDGKIVVDASTRGKNSVTSIPSLKKQILTTTQDKLAYIATYPETQDSHPSKIETDPILPSLAKELRDFNTHLGIKSHHSEPHDALADLRKEAATHMDYTMQYDGHADFPQYPVNLINDLNQAVHTLQSTIHNTGISYENATSAQQQMNTIDQAQTTNGVKP